MKAGVLPDTVERLLFTAGSSAGFFIFIVLLVRLMGKRTTSQMNNFDWIIMITVGSIVASGILLPNVSLAGAAVAILVLAACQWLTTHLALRSQSFRRVVRAEPRLLVRNGMYLREAMRQERVALPEVEAKLREAGLVDVSEAGWVVLETNGAMSIIPRHQQGAARSGTVQEFGSERSR